MVQRLQLQDFAADFGGCGFIGVGEEGVVLGAVEEGALRSYEMAGEEDVAAEGGEKGVQLGGGGGGEGWECAYRGLFLAGGCQRGDWKGAYHVFGERELC